MLTINSQLIDKYRNDQKYMCELESSPLCTYDSKQLTKDVLYKPKIETQTFLANVVL
jgi:hypothetical protein